MSDRPPEPADPEEEGVEPKDPPPMQLEGARLLANEARAQLRARGFDDHQIDTWAETYITEESAGDVEDFVSWIAAREEE